MSFLPKYRPIVYSGKDGRQLTCLFKNCKIAARPEELVRQRIIRWLLKHRRFAKEQLTLEESQTYTDHRRGRPDIVIRDSKGTVRVIVEIKRPDKMLGDEVKSQALRYARKFRAPEVWLTNGERHRFFKRVQGQWTEREGCMFLGESVRIGRIRLPSPGNAHAVRKFMRNLGKDSGSPPFCNAKYFGLVLNLEKIIRLSPEALSLPYSFNGVHILEDRGTSNESVATPAGGFWNALYRIFLVATEGRVETAGIGLNVWDEDRVILCVLFIKPNRKHHSLQVQLVGNSKRNSDGSFTIFHSGRMGGRSLATEKVFEAVIEAGRDDLIVSDPDTGQRRIMLGRVPEWEKVSWTRSREFIANLLHYALIRSNLREANPYSH